MLSSVIIRSQRFLIIIDDLGEEIAAKAIMTQFLRERGEQNIRYIDIFGELRTPTTRQDFLNECKSPFNLGHQQWNVILPTLSDLLIQFRPSVLFELFQHLKRCRWVKRTLLWIVPDFLIHKKSSYIVTCCKYMADLVLHLKSPNLLTVLVNKSNGTVSCRSYNYKRDKLKYILDVDPITGARNGRVAIPDERTNEALKPTTSSSSSAFAESSQSMGMKLFDGTDCGSTFKITLNEEELVARNTLKLPYEKLPEMSNQQSRLPDNIYVDDDMDDEDPDNDLNI